MSSEAEADGAPQPPRPPQTAPPEGPTDEPHSHNDGPGDAPPPSPTPKPEPEPDRSRAPKQRRPAELDARPDFSGEGLAGKVALALSDIKIAHSVFALPFALLGAFLAGPGRDLSAGEPTRWAPFAGKLAIIVLCMVLARTWAMLVNRLADRRLDADNPRTAKRAFAAQKLSAMDGLLMLAGSGGMFIGACALFTIFFDNLWPLYGSIPVLIWIAFYSFTKRFTLLCHFFLGSALAISPLAAAAAVDPEALKLVSLWCLSGMVLCWVAGFDVIYALQDHEHDAETGLHSIPARLGPKRAINLSRILHAACFALLLAAWGLNPNLASIFAIGVGATGVLLIAEHLVLTKRGEAGLNMAFFTLNGVISLVLGATGIVDLFA